MRHYLGYLDATQHEEQKKFLPNAFVLTQKIKRALAYDICFVCGRKGSGKSAVATMLSRLRRLNHDTEFKACGTLSEYEFGFLYKSLLTDLHTFSKQKAEINSSLEECYFEIWSYIIDLMTLLTVLQIKKDTDQYIVEFNIITQYLNKLNDQITFDEASEVLNFVLDKCFKAFEEFKNSVSPLSNLTHTFRKLRTTKEHKTALNALDAITENNHIAITIDTMEKYDISEFKLYPFRGLCLAVKHYVTTRKNKSIHIKCCLPAEMTDDLFQENLAKFNAVSVYLTWSYSELLEFFAKRYCFFLQENYPDHPLTGQLCEIAFSPTQKGGSNRYWHKSFWSLFGSPAVRNKFNSPENTCAYIIRHTQKRPREFLSCMNFILEYAIKYDELPKISEKSVVEGLHDEHNIWQLLSDNLAIFTLPKTDKSIVQIASSILVDEKVTFEGKEFNRFAKRTISELSSTEIIDKLTFSKNLLLRSGLVGRIIPYNNKSLGHSWIDQETGQPCKYYVTEFEYLTPGQVEITEESMCAVHPMLSDKLKLFNHENDIGVVYPIPEDDDLTEKLNETYGQKPC